MEQTPTSVSPEIAQPNPQVTPQISTRKRPREERDSKITAADPNRTVNIFEWDEKLSQYKDVKVTFKQSTAATQYSSEYQAVDNKRQASRNDFNKSLRRLAFKIKNVTDDDVFVAVRDFCYFEVFDFKILLMKMLQK